MAGLVPMLAAAPAQAATSLQVWLTTANGSSALAQQSNVTLGPVSHGLVNVEVNDSQTYQTMVGFGAAFTDSSTFLMAELKSYSSSAYNTLMQQLFSTSSGIGLQFWRLPMTSSDFNSTSSPWTGEQPHRILRADRSGHRPHHSCDQGRARDQLEPQDSGQSLERAGMDEVERLDDLQHRKREWYLALPVRPGVGGLLREVDRGIPGSRDPDLGNLTAERAPVLSHRLSGHVLD
jgi:hypothetical protein